MVGVGVAPCAAFNYLRQQKWRHSRAAFEVLLARDRHPDEETCSSAASSRTRGRGVQRLAASLSRILLSDRSRDSRQAAAADRLWWRIAVRSLAALPEPPGVSTNRKSRNRKHAVRIRTAVLRRELEQRSKPTGTLAILADPCTMLRSARRSPCGSRQDQRRLARIQRLRFHVRKPRKSRRWRRSQESCSLDSMPTVA